MGLSSCHDRDGRSGMLLPSTATKFKNEVDWCCKLEIMFRFSDAA